MASSESGLGALEDLRDELYATGRTPILCGAREQPALLLRKAEFHAHVGDANICLDLDDALVRAKVLLAERARVAVGSAGPPHP